MPPQALYLLNGVKVSQRNLAHLLLTVPSWLFCCDSLCSSLFMLVSVHWLHLLTVCTRMITVLSDHTFTVRALCNLSNFLFFVSRASFSSDHEYQFLVFAYQPECDACNAIGMHYQPAREQQMANDFCCSHVKPTLNFAHLYTC